MTYNYQQAKTPRKRTGTEAWAEQAEEYSRVDAYGRSRLSQQKEIKKAEHDENTDHLTLADD